MTHHVGERVRVATRDHEGHHRTPGYLKGRIGTVELVHGSFANPESRAYGADGLPEQPLYLICFDRYDIRPDERAHARDRIYADVYEHWLEKVNEQPRP